MRETASDILSFREPLPLPGRFLMGALGAGALALPVFLYFALGAHIQKASIVTLSLFASSAMVVGGAFLFSVFYGATRIVTVEKSADRTLRVQTKGLLKLSKAWTHSLFGLRSIGVVCEDLANGKKLFSVKAAVDGETRPVLVAAFPEEEIARRLAKRLNAAIIR